MLDAPTGTLTLLLSLSMFGAFVFGLCGHFLLPGADNVLQLPSSVWRIPFQVTAALLMVLQAAETVVGVRCLSAAMRWQKVSHEKNGGITMTAMYAKTRGIVIYLLIFRGSRQRVLHYA